MNAQELAAAYQQFFVKSNAGKFFANNLTDLIDSQHRSAEEDGSTARDYTQRAKGVREVADHINVVIAGGMPKK